MNRGEILCSCSRSLSFQKMFLSDLLTFAKEQARIETIDYFDPDPRFRRNHEVSGWRHDKNCRDYARKCLFRKFPARLKNAHNEKLVPGSYGRLKISEGDIDYTVGQYAPREIYGAVLDYLQQTNSI